ncbi:MAG: transposase, partial [Clostridiales bacterium]|nr:transposase [Clostridiales bacterium]
MTLAERFRNEGKEEGLERGETNALARTTLKLLTKKFGLLPE